VRYKRGRLFQEAVDRRSTERLDTVSRAEMGFPHDFLNKELVQAFSFGGLKNSIDAP